MGAVGWAVGGGQESGAIGTLEHRDGAEGASCHADRRRDADRCPGTGLGADGPAGARVEDAAVARAADVEVALVVATRGQRAFAEVDAGHCGERISRVLDAEALRCTVAAPAQYANVAALIDVAMPHTCRRQRGRLRTPC